MPAQAPVRASLAALVAAEARSQSPQGQASASQQPLPAARPKPQLVHPRSPAILAPGQLSTAELWRQAQSTTAVMRNSLIELSYVLWQLDQRADWQSLSLPDADAAREELGLTSNSWRTYLKLGERLVASGLTIEQLRRLTVKSATLLTRVHPALWHEFAWIEEAMALDSKQFAALVEERNRLASSSSSSNSVVHPRLAEPKAQVTLTLPASQVPVVEQRLTKLRATLAAKSNAEVLTAALDAAEHQAAAKDHLTRLQQQLDSLAALWPTAWASQRSESPAERDQRYETGLDLTAAGHSTASLAQQLHQTMKELHAVLS